jgi:hypothetical protein
MGERGSAWTLSPGRWRNAGTVRPAIAAIAIGG